MAVYFADSSALVKRYRMEAGSSRLAALLSVADRLLISRLAQIEVSAAIIRRGRSVSIPMHEISKLLATLDRDIVDSIEIVELNQDVVSLATIMTRKHGLRGADGIQLACCLIARDSAPASDFILLASDQELNAAAFLEGVTVLDPTKE